jgi:chromate transporter
LIIKIKSIVLIKITLKKIKMLKLYKGDIMKNRLNFFLSFLKIGGLTFGGGYAMIPIIQAEILEHGYCSESDVMSLVVISELTPGVFAINAATYIGYKYDKFRGALLATIGVILIPVIIISLLYYFLYGFRSNEYVNYAFKGINASVSVLILKASLSIGKNLNIKNILNLVVIVGSILVSLLTNFSILYVMLIVLLISIIKSVIVLTVEKRRKK